MPASPNPNLPSRHHLHCQWLGKGQVSWVASTRPIGTSIQAPSALSRAGARTGQFACGHLPYPSLQAPSAFPMAGARTGQFACLRTPCPSIQATYAFPMAGARTGQFACLHPSYRYRTSLQAPYAFQMAGARTGQFACGHPPYPSLQAPSAFPMAGERTGQFACGHPPYPSLQISLLASTHPIHPSYNYFHCLRLEKDSLVCFPTTSI
jgi:hypothetical protein